MFGVDVIELTCTGAEGEDKLDGEHIIDFFDVKDEFNTIQDTRSPSPLSSPVSSVRAGGSDASDVTTPLAFVKPGFVRPPFK